jgi:hypothetical protein
LWLICQIFLICTLFLSLSPKIRLYKGIGHRNPPYLGFLSDGFCFQWLQCFFFAVTAGPSEEGLPLQSLQRSFPCRQSTVDPCTSVEGSRGEKSLVSFGE